MTDRTSPSAASASLPIFYTIDQIATHLQVSTKTLHRWIKAGDLVAHRIGRKLRISESDLQAFIKLRRDG